MTRATVISAGAYAALTEALTYIYWRKKDLRTYLRRTLPGNPEVLDNLDWENPERYKFYIARDIVERLQSRPDWYHQATIDLMLDVADFPTFAHLNQYEDAELKIAKAKQAVDTLKEWVKPYERVKAERVAAQERRERQRREDAEREKRQRDSDELRQRFAALHRQSDDPWKRGKDFEYFLADLFERSDLDPVRPFKLQGEQIDGAFTFDGTEYLVEARWTQEPMQPKDVRDFQGKVQEKLDNTLGLFISMRGFTESAKSIHLGVRRNVLMADGAHLSAVLEGRIDLLAMLLRLRRHAATTGEVYLPIWEALAEG